MSMFRPNLLTMAMITAGFTLSSFAYAQQDVEKDESADVEVIEVRGFMRSLVKSIDQKRFADTVTEQLSADDLGALPDVSMADALTRLPGISAVRTGGQAAEINIRGMSGDFVFSTLNGREQVSTSGDRSIEFDQYPSELIQSAAVYKSPKASLIEGGVAGSVELKTASPLSIDGDQKFGMNVRGMYNDRASEVPGASETGNRISFSYQGKFLDETLGVALGYARLFQPSASTQFIGLAYKEYDRYDRDAQGNRKQEIPAVANFIDRYVGESVSNADNPLEYLYTSEGFEMQHKGGEETRNGYMATIEWAPTDDFVLKVDGFLSKFDSIDFARGFRVKLGEMSADAYNANLYNGNIVTGGNIARGTQNGWTRTELVNDDNTDYDQVASVGINADWQITDNLSVQLDISHSSAESDFRNGLLWSLVAEDANAAVPEVDNNVFINYQLNGLDLPDLAFNQADAFTDINRVMVSKYGIYPYQNDDNIDAYRFDAQYVFDDAPLFSGVEVGVRYSDREYNNDRSVFEYGSDSSFDAAEPPLQLTDDMVEVVDWQGAFNYFPSYLAIDLDKALNAWFPNGTPQPVKTWGYGHSGLVNDIAEQDMPIQPRNYDWTMKESGAVYEQVLAAYVQLNIDTEIGDIPVTGNLGVRMVESEQASTVLQNVAEAVVDENGETIAIRGNPNLGAQYIMDDVGLISDFYRPTVISDSYTDYLPSLNLSFQISDNEQIRIAAAKVMGRPPINRLFADASTSVSAETASIDPDTNQLVLSRDFAELTGKSRNNPYLRPFYADQFDLSYERYFDDSTGAFVAAVFHKEIKSFINDITIPDFDFAGNGFSVPSEVRVYLTEQNADGELQAKLDANGDREFLTLPTVNGNYETAVNNKEGGYIRGLELAYTQIYSDLPGMLSGLGANISYSFTESEIQSITDLGGSSVPQALPGLSENVVSATIFWAYEDFETRLSARYRDAFVSKQVAVNEQIVNFASETVVDYQASYLISDNMSLLFQMNNLTDEPTMSYFGSEAITGTIQYFGRQAFMGFTYSL